VNGIGHVIWIVGPWVLAVLVIGALAHFCWLYFQLRTPGVQTNQIYGNWSQAAAVVAATILGFSSLFMSLNVYSLQQTLRADTALDRAARTIQFAQAQAFLKFQALQAETKDPHAAERSYNCMYYLGDRLDWTPDWFGQLKTGQYLMAPRILGAPPHKDEPGLAGHFDAVAQHFEDCAGIKDQEVAAGAVQAGSAVVGNRIRRFVRYALDSSEASLMGWDQLQDDDTLQSARSFVMCEVGAELCGTSAYKDDVHALFTRLRDHAKGHGPAADFSRGFLRDYPSLSSFLKYACDGTPSRVERECMASP
jgi:hypothetical protein